MIHRYGNKSANITTRELLLTTENHFKAVDTETQMEFSKLQQSIGISPEGLTPPYLRKSQGKYGRGDTTKMPSPTKHTNIPEILRPAKPQKYHHQPVQKKPQLHYCLQPHIRSPYILASEGAWGISRREAA